MTVQCPICSRVNPSSATYCYYDGRALTEVSGAARQRPGTMPFATPFSFPDGQSCGNFDQLALACDRRWNDARTFLTNGIWCAFLSKIGRFDLAVAAEQAAKETDPDLGLSYLLERLPTDALRRPALSLLSETEDLGKLQPGADHKFKLVISNKGGLVLTGRVTSDCDWLFFGDRQGSTSRKLFQTRDNYTLAVTVIGSKLRAGQKPLEGQIVIESNGESAAVAVKALVPVVPFPRGGQPGNVLAGAKSPREVALKAKAHPQEAATLFEQGAVKAWYTSNGWTYPVQGTQGKGKGGVQQFFEALGLSKPPLLEINTDKIECEGPAGEKLTKHIIVSTKEAKFVHAEAHSDQPWVKVQPSIAKGKIVTIPLVIVVPHFPGQSYQTQVTVQGNGQQRFVVPVTLTVQPSAEEEERAVKAAERKTWVLAVAGALLLLALGAGVLLFVKQRRGGEPAPLVPVAENGQPQQQTGTIETKGETKTETWWDGMPDQKLAVNAAELKANTPADCQAIVGRAMVKSDTERFTAYEQLAAKLPELVRNVKTREPLARFVTECCVYEPSELNISNVLRGLAGLFPKEGAAFDPAAKGQELEDALYARKILFDAMSHRAIRPERARSLANVFGTIFGFALDTSARLDELKVETEKLLALRCYRSLLPTAARSIEHALDIRAMLIEKFPQQLAQPLRDPVDVDLLAVGLDKGGQALWPKLEPIFKSCLASDEAAIGRKLIEVYAKADADLAPKMEELMAPKWKEAANARWSQAEKVAALRKALSLDPGKVKQAMADRFRLLQKRIDKDLKPVKSEQKSDIVPLQQAVRLAHASTLSSILFNKDAEVERFDELLKHDPDAKPAAMPEEKKPPDDKPAPAMEDTPKVIEIMGRPYSVSNKLTAANEREPGRETFRRAYPVSLRAGQVYTIDLMSTEFKPYLRLESPDGRQRAAANDRPIGGIQDAKIVYVPPASGVYRVIATTAVKGATGAYTLQIQLGNGFGGFGLGMPFPRRKAFGPRFVPVAPGFPAMPEEQPKDEQPKGKDKESEVSKSDLASLANAQRTTRVTAFKNLVGNLPNNLEVQHAEKIARYLLVTITTDAELEEVSDKLDSLGSCRNLLSALADIISIDDKLGHERTAAVVGGILGKQLRFARDEDWRSAARKLLLQRALDLTSVSPTAATADMVAQFLRDLYKEQGLAFGVEGEEFLAHAQPSRVLEALIKHVAAKVEKKDLAAADKEYLEQIDRHLKAAQFVADNDLENMVLLQRIWLRVLIAYLQEQVPAQAAGMQTIQNDLAIRDRNARNVFDQLRLGEEKVLRVWVLAHNLKGK
jgi:hypothetical protein